MSIKKEEFNELTVKAKAGDEESFNKIWAALQSFLRWNCKKTWLGHDGLTNEDIIQECYFAMQRAINSYDPVRGNARSYICLAIRCSIITMIKHNANKNSIWNTMVSLNNDKKTEATNDGFDEDYPVALGNRLVVDYKEPDEELILNENLEKVKKAFIESLTDLEKVVLEAYLIDKSYLEIAKALKAHRYKPSVKCADNALCRIRSKARKICHEFPYNDF